MRDRGGNRVEGAQDNDAQYGAVELYAYHFINSNRFDDGKLW